MRRFHLPASPAAALLLAACALAATAASAPCQRPLQAIPLGRPAPFLPHVTYDEARQRVTLFGARGEATDWTGTSFDTRLGTGTASLSGSLGYQATAIAYDSIRGGTFAVDWSGDWFHDGRDWTQITAATRPSQRFAHAIAFDSARDRVVLFGGNVPTTFGADDETWEWDGSTWTQRNPASRPPALQEHAMAYDPLRQRVVLFGGRDRAFNGRRETWEWDGSTWMQAQPVHIPSDTTGRMVFDAARSRIVFSGPGSGLWAYDGTDWTELVSGTFPTFIAANPRTGEIVGFGGGDPHVWDGVQVTRPRTTGRATGEASTPMVLCDPTTGAVTTFGGSLWGNSGCTTYTNPTWTWDGNTWTQRTPAVSPPARRNFAATALDGGRVLVFGGGIPSTCSTGAPFDDLWEWNGTTWDRRTATTGGGPSWREASAMAYDSARGRAVLFGGVVSWTGPIDETWEWDGATWRQIQTPQAPPPARYHAKIAYDRVRGRTVLFGGFDATRTALADTWEWDGAVWLQRQPTHVPPASAESHSLFFDPTRGHVVLVASGGTAWEWTGLDWQSIPLAAPLHGAVGFDPISGDWITPVSRIGDFASRRSGAALVGNPCGGAVHVATISCTKPRIPNPHFRIDVTGAPASSTGVLLLGTQSNPTLVGGCTFYPAAQVFLQVSTNTYGATWVDLPIPNAPSLNGMTLHAQAVVADGTAPLGIDVTDALWIDLGEF